MFSLIYLSTVLWTTTERGKLWLSPLKSESNFVPLFNVSFLQNCIRSAMDVLFEEMLYPFAPGGALEHLGGLDFASAPLIVNPINAGKLFAFVIEDALFFSCIRLFLNYRALVFWRRLRH